jgi:hypothetical protein
MVGKVTAKRFEVAISCRKDTPLPPSKNLTEENSGSVFLEVDMLLFSESGRAKHLDLDEQGFWLAEWLWSRLDEQVRTGEFQGIAVPGLSTGEQGLPVMAFRLKCSANRASNV